MYYEYNNLSLTPTMCYEYRRVQKSTVRVQSCDLFTTKRERGRFSTHHVTERKELTERGKNCTPILRG